MSESNIPKTQRFPTADSIERHPAFEALIWDLEPTRTGTTQVADGRRCGPFPIFWVIHGHGQVKVVLICGWAARHVAWQRQTLHFGHINEDKYSVLIIDNRGVGPSGRPWWYSTSEMARDLVEVLDDVGWTEKRQLHVVGLSLGGQIAQELAMLAPERISTLNLCHTTARFETTWAESWASWRGMLKERTLDETIEACALAFFDPEWLDAPDDIELPPPGTPRVGLPACGEYRLFETNYQRYAAAELLRQKSAKANGADKWAMLMHFVASSWHSKSDKQLRWMAEQIGPERIMVVHTTRDATIPVKYAEHLVKVMNVGRNRIIDGAGHVPKLEKSKWLNKELEESFANGERLTGLETRKMAGSRTGKV